LCVVQDELGLYFCCLLRFCWHQILCSLIITSLNSILLDEITWLRNSQILIKLYILLLLSISAMMYNREIL
jgi:hypothetical protein